MADVAGTNPDLIVLETSRALPQFRELALLLAEDAQLFAGALELSEAALSPAEAIRLFGRKLREMAWRLAPEPASLSSKTWEGWRSVPL